MADATGLARFDDCLKFTLQQEGGFSDTPGDAGGATNFGITLSTFRHWTHDANASVEQLKAISAQERSGIYNTGYWTPPQCGALPQGVDLSVFDFCVNAGPRVCIHVLQHTLGVPADGLVGPVTIAAARRSGRPLILALGRAQSDFYRGLVEFPTFGKGWIARTERRTAAALRDWDDAAAAPVAVPPVIPAPVPPQAPAPSPAVSLPVPPPLVLTLPPAGPVPVLPAAAPDPVPITFPAAIAPIPAPALDPAEAPSMAEISDVVGGALKGAAAGMVLGPVGAAGGAAVALAIQLVPQLARWLAGDNGATIGKVVSVVEQVTGAQSPTGQAAAVADPAVATDLAVQLAQIAADRQAAHETAQNDALVATLADTADARAQTITLAASGSGLAWGAPVVSIVLALGFFASLLTMILAPPKSDPGTAAMLYILIGALSAGFTQVTSFWIGSSLGSSRKTDILANSIPARMLPVPAAIVPARDAK